MSEHSRLLGRAEAEKMLESGVANGSYLRGYAKAIRDLFCGATQPKPIAEYMDDYAIGFEGKAQEYDLARAQRINREGL